MSLEIAEILRKFDGSALRRRGLCDIYELSDEEMLRLLDLAAILKQRKRAGTRGDLLLGKNIALIFEKMSTRTRAAAVVAVADEGGATEYLSAGDIHIGKKESVKDTARVLGRLFDGVLFRGYAHDTMALLAQHAGIPVWNGLTDDSHPTQALADLMTIRENFGRLAGLKVVYMGDGRNNVANSLMAGCVKAGIHFVNCAPELLAPRADLAARSEEVAARTGGSVSIIHDPTRALPGANVVYTDVWVSMGEESKREERIRLLRPYQVTAEMMRRTGNLNAGQAIFLHCLPAFHDHNTHLTRDIGALEVTDEVFEAPYSRVFDQAENRMHTIKAMIVASLL
ncbi:MAG: ornithine carbamoyltransferase [Verrucomicrobiota bacterium]|nr:ornithine carbamoyltransferase [Verrucomicrobiota bacterium]